MSNPISSHDCSAGFKIFKPASKLHIQQCANIKVHRKCELTRDKFHVILTSRNHAIARLFPRQGYARFQDVVTAKKNCQGTSNGKSHAPSSKFSPASSHRSNAPKSKSINNMRNYKHSFPCRLGVKNTRYCKIAPLNVCMQDSLIIS